MLDSIMVDAVELSDSESSGKSIGDKTDCFRLERETGVETIGFLSSMGSVGELNRRLKIDIQEH